MLRIYSPEMKAQAHRSTSIGTAWLWVPHIATESLQGRQHDARQRAWQDQHGHIRAVANPELSHQPQQGCTDSRERSREQSLASRATAQVLCFQLLLSSPFHAMQQD